MKKIFLLLALFTVALGVKADEPVYTATGMTTSAAGWDPSLVPEMNGIPVEVYEDYLIIRSFYGVEGYDLMVTPSVTNSLRIDALTVFVNGVEGETQTEGYIEIPTGNEETPIFKAYISSTYGYVWLSDEDEEGYVLIPGFVGGEWNNYYIVWPEEEPWEPVDLDGAVLEYTGVAVTGDAESWGESAFPEVTNIPAEGYDKYIILKSFAGVEGYDVLVAYNEDEIATSVVSIVNGEMGEQEKNPYIPTGREDYPWILAYPCNYSYASCYGEEGGYVCLTCYIYDADNNAIYSYYYAYWDEGTPASSIVVPADQVNSDSPMFNLKGQRVNDQYKGIIIQDGVKVLNK